jgi:hypothetical protein
MLGMFLIRGIQAGNSIISGAIKKIYFSRMKSYIEYKSVNAYYNETNFLSSIVCRSDI